MSFLVFTWFIFDFSFLLTHMSLWMVFILVLRFLEFYMSNNPNSKLKLWKLANFWDCLKFGSADGPRVRGGRSALHEVFHQRLWSAENYSADSPPMNRGRSARCTGKLRLHRWCVHYASADGPPSIRGRSAWDKLNLPRKVTNIGLILSHLNWKVLKLIIFTSGWGA